MRLIDTTYRRNLLIQCTDVTYGLPSIKTQPFDTIYRRNLGYLFDIY